MAPLMFRRVIFSLCKIQGTIINGSRDHSWPYYPGKTCLLFATVTQFITLGGPLMSLYHCNTDIVAGIAVPYPTNPSLEWK